MVDVNSINCSIEELYCIVSHEDIFRRYVPDFHKIGQLFQSEFRKDKNPSCEIKYSRNDQLYYKDYGEEGFLTPLSYVMKKFSLGINGGIRLIMKDFNKTNKDIVHKPVTKLSSSRLEKIIQKKGREWTTQDLHYWSEHGWTRKMLDQANIEPISQFWIDGDMFAAYGKVYCFNYYVNKDIFRRKLYFPEKLSYRFISNTDDTIIQGWDLLPKEGGEVLFITSSFKDIGPFWRINSTCNACAPSSETILFPEEPFNKLKERWKRIVLYFDNDETGIKFAKKFSKQYDIEYDHTPLGEPKDPSDYVKKYGLNNFKKLIKKYYD